jgi:hypothetical protein
MAEPDLPPGKGPEKGVRIAVVGPCASGKSTLATGLKTTGFDVRQPAQEHSYVPDMWQRISQPDLLIYLDVNYTHVSQRRPQNNGGPQRLSDQHRKLAHAREHCDLYVDTSSLSADEVLAVVTNYLKQH